MAAKAAAPSGRPNFGMVNPNPLLERTDIDWKMLGQSYWNSLGRGTLGRATDFVQLLKVIRHVTVEGWEPDETNYAFDPHGDMNGFLRDGVRKRFIRHDSFVAYERFSDRDMFKPLDIPAVVEWPCDLEPICVNVQAGSDEFEMALSLILGRFNASIMVGGSGDDADISICEIRDAAADSQVGVNDRAGGSGMPRLAIHHGPELKHLSRHDHLCCDVLITDGTEALLSQILGLGLIGRKIRGADEKTGQLIDEALRIAELEASAQAGMLNSLLALTQRRYQDAADELKMFYNAEREEVRRKTTRKTFIANCRDIELQGIARQLVRTFAEQKRRVTAMARDGGKDATWVEQQLDSHRPTAKNLRELLDKPIGERALQKWAKRHFNRSPLDYIFDAQIDYAKELIEERGAGLAELLTELDLDDETSFREKFMQHAGVTLDDFILKTLRQG